MTRDVFRVDDRRWPFSRAHPCFRSKPRTDDLRWVEQQYVAKTGRDIAVVSEYSYAERRDGGVRAGKGEQRRGDCAETLTNAIT